MLLRTSDELGHRLVFKLNDIRRTGLCLNRIVELGILRASLTGIRPAHLKVIMSFIELIDDLLDGRIPSPYGHLFHAWLLDLVLALGAVIGLLVVVDLASGVAATASTARRDGKGHHTCGQCRDCLLHVLHELLL